MEPYSNILILLTCIIWFYVSYIVHGYTISHFAMAIMITIYIHSKLWYLAYSKPCQQNKQNKEIDKLINRYNAMSEKLKKSIKNTKITKYAYLSFLNKSPIIKSYTPQFNLQNETDLNNIDQNNLIDLKMNDIDQQTKNITD